MTITSYGYDGTVGETQWAQLASYLGHGPKVATDADFKATIVVGGADRAVTFAAGEAYDYGVLAKSNAPITLQFDVSPNGTRWDTVSMRREWGSNTSSLVIQKGTIARAVAAGLHTEKGVSADQPLYLVQITAGVAVATQVFDLRVRKDITLAEDYVLSETGDGLKAAITRLAGLTTAVGLGGLRHFEGDLATVALAQTPSGLWISNSNVNASYGTIVSFVGGGSALQLAVSYGVGNSNSPDWAFASARTFSAGDGASWGPWWRLA